MMLDDKNLGMKIAQLIDLSKGERATMLRNYQEYMGAVEIKKRIFENELKVNNQLANDFRGEIVDGLVGYMFGKPVVWKVENEKFTESERKRIERMLSNFRKINGISDIDAETAEYMSVCGYGARLCWVGLDGLERVKNLKPWEVTFVTDSGTEEVINALYFYEKEMWNGGTRWIEERAEWYDGTFVHFFVNYGQGFIRDSREPENPKKHLFDFVPVIRFENNNLLMSDFEKVRSLIDAFDRVLSDSQNEIEEFRLAYMVFVGAEPTEEIMRQARKTGAFGTDEGTDIRFITKQINGEFIRDHLKLLNDNIYKFAMAVDMSDEKFSGFQQSGESRKWKLLAFENRAVKKERKFEKGLRAMFRVLCSAWKKKEIPLKAEDLDFEFTRNLPADMLYSAEVSTKLKGLVSEKTRLGLLPFVEDVEKEIKLLSDDDPPDNRNQNVA